MGCGKEVKTLDLEARTECGEEEGKRSKKKTNPYSKGVRTECAQEREEAGSVPTLPWEVGAYMVPYKWAPASTLSKA